MNSSLYSGVEVSGESLGAIVDGFRQYPSVAVKYLEKYRIVSQEQDVDRSVWYPLPAWLDALTAMASEIGANSMHRIGKSVPEHSAFPPHITDVYGAVASIDVAYHMNHRKNGVVMFDPQSGEHTEGIGHYGCEPREGENRIVCVCDTPYPCEFDRGVIGAIAARFEPMARAVHDPEAACRAKGGKSCTYVVFW